MFPFDGSRFKVFCFSAHRHLDSDCTYIGHHATLDAFWLSAQWWNAPCDCGDTSFPRFSLATVLCRWDVRDHYATPKTSSHKPYGVEAAMPKCPILQFGPDPKKCDAKL